MSELEEKRKSLDDIKQMVTLAIVLKKDIIISYDDSEQCVRVTVGDYLQSEHIRKVDCVKDFPNLYLSWF